MAAVRSLMRRITRLLLRRRATELGTARLFVLLTVGVAAVSLLIVLNAASIGSAPSRRG